MALLQGIGVVVLEHTDQIPATFSNMTGDAFCTRLKSSSLGFLKSFFHDRAQKIKKKNPQMVLLFKTPSLQRSEKKLDIFFKDHLFVAGEKTLSCP